jgi:selenocysteine lyase/cysteine desulfurase
VHVHGLRYIARESDNDVVVEFANSRSTIGAVLDRANKSASPIMRNKDEQHISDDSVSDDYIDDVDDADRHQHRLLLEQQQQQPHDDDGTAVAPPVAIYLNNAHQASRLDPSVQRVGVACIGKEPWQQQQQQQQNDVADDQYEVRRLFAQLIGVDDAADIAIMPSTAFAVTLAAHNIFLDAAAGRGDNKKQKGGGRILVVQDQFDSAVYPWQEICHLSHGAISLDVVPYPSRNETWTHAVMERLQNSNSNNNNNSLDDITIRAVCLPPLHWADGALLDLHIIGTFCEQHAIPFIVDATQAVGIFPMNVASSIPGCSMLACSVHKWLRAPPGTSLVYIQKDLHDTWHPLDQHAFGRNLPYTQEASRYAMGPTGYPWETYYTDARKFDSGGNKANSLLLPMLCASLQLVVQLDLYQVQAQLGALMQPLLDWATAHHHGGFAIPARHAHHSSGLDYAYHLVGIRPTTREMSADELLSITQQLQENKGIYIAARCGGLRISPYLDNSQQDIDRLVLALQEIIVNDEKKRP